MEHQEVLKNRSIANYIRLVGDKKLLIIDEVQTIPDVGLQLKLIVDSISCLRVIASCSSAFDLNNKIGEPLVGRKIDFNLFPLSQHELSQKEDFLTTRLKREEWLIFESYPGLEQLQNREDKINILKVLSIPIYLRALLLLKEKNEIK